DPSYNVANGGDGVVIQDSYENQVGTFGADVIAGNKGRGVYVTGSASQFNEINYNYIGTDPTATVQQGNGSDGIRVSEGAYFNFFVSNVIANNSGRGVVIGANLADNAASNDVAFNRIFNNAHLGIDLGNDGVTPNLPGSPQAGPNRLVNFPVITSAVSAGNT